jgi:serine/threonine protein kinase
MFCSPDQSLALWSLGAIMFKCLVGYPPFCVENASITYKKVDDVAIAPQQVSALLPLALFGIPEFLHPLCSTERECPSLAGSFCCLDDSLVRLWTACEYVSAPCSLAFFRCPDDSCTRHLTGGECPLLAFFILLS